MAILDILTGGKSNQVITTENVAKTGGTQPFSWISTPPEDFLSYASFLYDRQQFRRAGTRYDEFNLYDTPGHLYFRILFHFFNGDDSKTTGPAGGLLAPTWQLIGNYDDNYPFYEHNSAWAYLKMNGENQRADLLEQFINLLSNISTNSPWYFTSISGMDEALKRKGINDAEGMKIDAERKRIVIQCLPDAFDTRIATLLSLYRSIVWSWQRKCEIVPSNLRKFDMSIYVFNTPIRNMHSAIGKAGFASLNSSSSEYRPSYKCYEFHNCEFGYNSLATGLSSLNNAEGTQGQYNIEIEFDDVYETSWNEFITRSIGDIILLDVADAVMMAAVSNPDLFGDNHEALSDTKYRSFYYNMGQEGGAEADNFQVYPTIGEANEAGKKENFALSGNIFYDEIKYGKPAARGFFGNIANELVGTAVDAVRGLITHLALGNLHTLSPAHLVNQVGAAMQGHLFSTIGAARGYLENQKKAETRYVDQIGKIMQSKTIYSNI